MNSVCAFSFCLVLATYFVLGYCYNERSSSVSESSQISGIPLLGDAEEQSVRDFVRDVVFRKPSFRVFRPAFQNNKNQRTFAVKRGPTRDACRLFWKNICW